MKRWHEEKGGKSIALFILFIFCVLLGCSRENDGKSLLPALGEMNSPYYSIGVPQSAAATVVVEEKFPKCKIKYFQSIVDGYLAVKYGKIDAFAFDRHALQYVTGHNADLTLMDEKVGDEFIVVGSAHGRDNLIKKVNAFIKQYRTDGTYQDMYNRWILGKNIKMPDLPEPKNPVMTLKIGTTGVNEPMNFYADGKLSGFDVEFTKRLALFLNAKCVFYTIEYPAIVAAALSGKIDLLIANLNVTPERRKKMLFSEPYIDSEISFLVRKDRLPPNISAKEPQSVPEQARTGINGLATGKVGVMTGTTAEFFIRKKYPQATVGSYDNIADAVAALQGDKLDYVVTAYTTAHNFVKNNQDLVMLPDRLISEGAAIAVAKDNEYLLKRLNEKIKQFKANGTLDRIVSHWIKDDNSDYGIIKIPSVRSGTILRVAIAANREPMCFVRNNIFAGLDCELIERIAYELGMQVEYTDMQFSALIIALQSGKADVIISNMTPTKERMEKVSFTEKYFNNPQVALVKKKIDSQQATDLAQLAGKKVGIITGSAYDNLLKSRVPGAIPEYFNNFSDQAEAVKSGKIAGFLADEPLARDILNHTSGLGYLDEKLSSDGYAFAFSKNRPELHKRVNDILQEMRNNGMLKKIDARWFGKDEAAKVLPDIKIEGKNGIIRLATNSGLAPFAYIKQGKMVGYDIEIAMIIAAKLGCQLEIVDMDFTAIIPSLLSGKNDMAAGGITITKERAQSVLFSIPNYTGGVVVMVARGADAIQKESLSPKFWEMITNISQLAGKKIGVQTGTTYEMVAKNQIPEATPMYFTTFTDQVEAVKTGKIAGFLVDEVVAQNVIRQTPGLTYLKKWLRTNEYAFAFSKKRTQLQRQVDAVLQEIKADGTLQKLEAKWFGADDTVRILPKRQLEGKKGVIRFATNSDCAPFVYMKNGKLVGYDIEVATIIAGKLGCRLELIDMDFSAIIPSLIAGKTDMAGAFIAVTKERAQSVLFSIPNYTGGTVLVVAAGSGAPQNVGLVGFWAELRKSFRRTFIVEDRYKLVLRGLGVTIVISLLSAIFGTILGFIVCLMRQAKTRWANIPARVFIRAIQGTPIVVLLMILYYIVFGSVDINAIAVAIVGFSINFAAYVSEMMRTGIDAVDKGQHEAALAIGFNRIEVFTRITFPQAARHVLPVFKGEFISMLKMTSVVGYIAIQDLTKISDIVRSRTYEAFFPLIATALIYFVIAYFMTFLLSRVEMKIDPKQRKRVVKGVVRS